MNFSSLYSGIKELGKIYQKIYCSNCWDSKGLLVQGQSDNDGTYYCYNCKEKKYYDIDLYNRTYHDNEYDDSNII